jgi:hypothetical protein
MVRPRRMSWGFSASPSAKVTLLQGEMASPGQVKERGNSEILKENGQTQEVMDRLGPVF